MTRDAIVIGSGQGGNPVSYALAEHGWTVAFVEKSHLAGTCINTGCTPTKTMIAAAQVAHFARNAAQWGVRTGRIEVDLSFVVDRKNAVVKRFRGNQERNVAWHPSLRLFRGHIRFLSSRQVQVDDEVFESDRIFIDTGTRPHPPNIAGLDSINYPTNESLMEIRGVPEHLLILGGGYFGLEFGQMVRRFGSSVTIVPRGPQMLQGEDADSASELEKALENEGVEFRLNSNPIWVEKREGKIALTIAAGGRNETITGSHLLTAAGRQPRAEYR